MLKYPCVHGKLQHIKKFSNEIFKRTRSGKQNLEESSRIEGCVNTKIQENYNLTTKTLPVDYADILLYITKISRVKNECYPFTNRHSVTI